MEEWRKDGGGAAAASLRTGLRRRGPARAGGLAAWRSPRGGRRAAGGSGWAARVARADPGPDRHATDSPLSRFTPTPTIICHASPPARSTPRGLATPHPTPPSPPAANHGPGSSPRAAASLRSSTSTRTGTH